MRPRARAIVAVVLGTIFLTELMVMFVLQTLTPGLTPWAEAMIDATVLSLTVSGVILWAVSEAREGAQANAPARARFSVAAAGAWRLFGLLVAAIFVTNSIVTLLLSLAPLGEHGWQESLIRAAGATVPIAGAIWWLVVTPIEKAAAQAARSRGRLDALVTASPAVIWAIRLEGDFGATYVSENVRERLGYAPETFTADPGFWERNIHPEDHGRIMAEVPAIIERGSVDRQYRFRHKDGSWRWMRDAATVVRDAQGRPRELVGYWIDVTARVEAEGALRDSEARSAAVIASALDAIVINDGEGRIVDFNPAAERIFGWTREQALGGMVDELLIPDSDGGQWRRDFRKSLRAGVAGFSDRRSEVRSLHADGHEFPSEIILQRIERDGRLYFIAFVRDISEQKRAQEALRASEARLRHLLAATPAVIWASRLEGDYGATFVSENVRAQLGYEPEAFTADSGFWADRLHPEERERVLADLPALIEHGRIEHQYRFRHADGSWRWMHGAATVVRDVPGEPAQIVGYWIDITARKTAEIALTESQRRQAALLDSIPDIAWLKDRESRFIAVNEPFARACGRRAEELPGLTDLDIWPRELAERYRADDAEVVRSGRPRRAEEPLEDAGGARTRIETVRVPVFDADGRVTGTAGIARDITERKTMARELDRSREQLQRALEASGVVLWEADATTGEVYLSGRWAEFVGAPRGETRTTVRELLALVHPKERQHLLDAAGQVLTGASDAYCAEHRVRTVGGGWRWVLSQGMVTERDPATGRALRISGTNLDITERRRAQAALEETLRAKTEFMNNVTHELRTPLNGVIGFAELLEERVAGPLNEKQSGFAADIHASGLHLLALVEGILEMSRLDAHGTALAREPVEVGEVLQERVAAHRKAAEARRISIALHVAPEAGSANLDPKALRRMLGALIDNAIKFNRDGGTVTVSANRTDGTLEIAVADTGIGIAQEDLTKLFRPLVQLDATLARKYGGIGLGLALARRLAEPQGGTIDVQSEPGKGSTFTLRLPMEKTS